MVGHAIIGLRKITGYLSLWISD